MRLVIFGPGGMGRELIGIARTSARGLGEGEDGDEIVFAADRPGEDVLGIPVIGEKGIGPGDRLVVALGASPARQRVAERLRHIPAAQLIAPTAIIGPDVTIGEGAVICDYCVVTASVRIGRHFQCNIHSYVAHDCVIGDFVTFAPRVSCNGNVHVGDGAYIGAGAVIRQGAPERPVVIGAGAVVGMGAVVTRDVPPGATVIGNPARLVEPRPR